MTASARGLLAVFAVSLCAGRAAAANVEFGSAVVGQSATATLTLSNPPGQGVLTIATLTSSDPSQFTVVTPLPIDIPVGGQANITLRFTPTSAGDQSATLNLTDPPHPPQTLTMHGVGVTGPVNGFTVQFGSVNIGSSALANFTLSDPYQTPLVVTSVVASDPQFTLTSPTLPYTLDVNTLGTFIMKFAPTVAGDTNAILTISFQGAQNTLLNLHGIGVSGPPPQINAGGVVNAADFTPKLSAGSLGTIFGSNFATIPASASVLPLSTSLSGVSVTVGGVPAPLVYVSSGQINFQVPFEVPNGVAPVVVSAGGQSSNSVNVTVADYGVGVFTYPRTATVQDPIVVHGADNTLITPASPAKPNEVVVVYANGVGKLSNAPATAAASPASPPAQAMDTPTVKVGGTPAQVSFAGLTPGLVGLVQLNVQLPPNLTTGSLPLSIQFPGDTSPTVNLAVQAPVVTVPKLALSANALAFGNVTVGQTGTQTFQISNTGNAALSVTALNVNGASFSVVSPTSGFAVQAGASQTVTVKFAPGEAGPAGGTLTVISNDSGSPASVSLSGTGVAPASASLSVNFTSLSFGSVNVGQSSTATLSVSNTGTGTLNVTSVTASAGFALVSPAVPFSVAPGASTTLTIRFSPTAAGDSPGTLTLSSNDPNSPTKVALDGTGVSTGAAPVIGVSTTTLAFGSVNIGQTATLPLTITNSGSAQLTVNSFAAPAGFSVVSPAAPFNVAPGNGSATVTVQFAPASAGSLSGSLTIASNDPAKPSVTVTLTGTGVTPTNGTVLLQIDGGKFTGGAAGVQGPATALFVVRLTPPAYPATLQNVQIFFGQRADGLPAGTPIGVVVGISPSGNAQFSATLTSYSSSIIATGQFNSYPLTAVTPPITATSGDFIVGFEVNEPAGIFPADLDTASPDQGRSYLSTVAGNSLNFTSVKGDLGIRATVKIGQ